QVSSPESLAERWLAARHQLAPTEGTERSGHKRPLSVCAGRARVPPWPSVPDEVDALVLHVLAKNRKVVPPRSKAGSPAAILSGGRASTKKRLFRRARNSTSARVGRRRACRPGSSRAATRGARGGTR